MMTLTNGLMKMTKKTNSDTTAPESVGYTQEFADALALISPSVIEAPEMRMRLNVGMMADIPTGSYIKLPDGRNVLNGGIHQTLGISGLPNTYKSTFMMTLTARALGRLLANNTPSNVSTYDTEITLERTRLQKIIDGVYGLAKFNPLRTGIWILSSKAEQDGTDWWAAVRKMGRSKIKNKRSIMVDTPFMNEQGIPYRVPLPTFVHLDSITAFRSKDTEDLDDKVELGDSKGLMLYMKSGLAKARLLTTMSGLAEAANIYFMASAHVGEASADVGAGPYALKPDKKLPTMRGNQRYKGVTDNFFSLLGGIWQTDRVAPLYNGDKKPMYPKNSHDNKDLDTDLIEITVKLMRSKSSGDGISVVYVLSKTEGFLIPLSEFHHIKTADYFGLVGSNINYVCALYPEVKLQRTNVRAKLETDERLQRAINICSEMLQIYTHRKHRNENQRMSPEELYEKLKTKGYNWDKILDSRGWYSLGTPPKGTLTITTMDLLEIATDDLERNEFKD